MSQSKGQPYSYSYKISDLFSWSAVYLLRVMGPVRKSGPNSAAFCHSSSSPVSSCLLIPLLVVYPSLRRIMLFILKKPLLRHLQSIWYSMDTNAFIPIISIKPYASPSKCHNAKVPKMFESKSKDHCSINIVHITTMLMKTRTVATDQLQLACLCTTYFFFKKFYWFSVDFISCILIPLVSLSTCIHPVPLQPPHKAKQN